MIITRYARSIHAIVRTCTSAHAYSMRKAISFFSNYFSKKIEPILKLFFFFKKRKQQYLLTRFQLCKFIHHEQQSFFFLMKKIMNENMFCTLATALVIVVIKIRRVTFIYVPGLASIRGNERAGRLASTVIITDGQPLD